MVGDPPGQLGGGGGGDEVVGEVEGAGVDEVEGECGAAVGEPGDLVVEVASVGRGGGVGVVEDGAGDQVEGVGWAEPGRGERLIQRVVAAVDVEVAQGHEVGAPGVGAGGPAGEPLGQGGEFGCAVGGGFAVADVQGGEGEAGGVAGEADRVGGAGELVESVGRHPGRSGCGDEFAGQSGGVEASGVVEEGEAFVVAEVAFGDVAGEEGPV